MLRQTPTQVKHEFVALDGLRGLAAFAIVIRHTPQLFGLTSNPAYALVPESFLAVDFFFVLSGFVIAHAYGRKFKNREMTPPRFLLRRIIRFYPLHFIASLIGFAALYLWGEKSIVSVLAAGLFFFPTSGAAGMFPLDPPVWSLHFELIINFIYAVVARRLDGKILAGFTGLTGAILALAVYFKYAGFGSSGEGSVADGFRLSEYSAGLIRVFFSFFAGVLIYRVFGSITWRISIPLPLSALPLLYILCSHPAEQYRMAYELSAVLVLFPAIVLLAACSRPGKTIARACSVVGSSSYAVYVLHLPLSRLIPRQVYSWPMGVLFLVLVLLFSLAADEFYDFPVRRTLLNATRKFCP